MFRIVLALCLVPTLVWAQPQPPSANVPIEQIERTIGGLVVQNIALQDQVKNLQRDLEKLRAAVKSSTTPKEKPNE